LAGGSTTGVEQAERGSAGKSLCNNGLAAEVFGLRALLEVIFRSFTEVLDWQGECNVGNIGGKVTLPKTPEQWEGCWRIRDRSEGVV